MVLFILVSFVMFIRIFGNDSVFLVFKTFSLRVARVNILSKLLPLHLILCNPSSLAFNSNP